MWLHKSSVHDTLPRELYEAAGRQRAPELRCLRWRCASNAPCGAGCRKPRASACISRTRPTWAAAVFPC